jgi:hypothetical protein
MVCGIDCFHDASKRGGSVAGFVASLNQTFTRWFSRVCFQGPNQELVDGLKTCFISALKCYYEVSIQLIWTCAVFNTFTAIVNLSLPVCYPKTKRFQPSGLLNLKSTVPGHFTTLWERRSTGTLSGWLVREAAEYHYSARAESVNPLPVQFNTL